MLDDYLTVSKFRYHLKMWQDHALKWAARVDTTPTKVVRMEEFKVDCEATLADLADFLGYIMIYVMMNTTHTHSLACSVPLNQPLPLCVGGWCRLCVTHAHAQGQATTRTIFLRVPKGQQGAKARWV